GEGAAAPATGADRLAGDPGLEKSNDATAVDAEGGGGKALRVAHQRARVDPGLVALAQVDEQHAPRLVPPLIARCRSRVLCHPGHILSATLIPALRATSNKNQGRRGLHFSPAQAI